MFQKLLQLLGIGNTGSAPSSVTPPAPLRPIRKPRLPQCSPRVSKILAWPDPLEAPENGVDEAARIATLHAAYNTPAHEVRPRLLLGSLKAVTPDFIAARRVTHVLNCLPATEAAGVPGVETLSLDLEDEPGQVLPLQDAVAFIERALAAPGSVVLVHCAMGVSRSVACVCAFIMRSERCAVETALRSVRAARPQALPNEGFLEQLVSFEKTLAA